MAAPIHNASKGIYLGQFPRVVDASHRFLLPIEWRHKGAPTTFFLLLQPFGAPEYLLALPPERWEKFWETWAQLPLANEDSAGGERQIGQSAFPCALDRFGRLPLPEGATQAAGIGDKSVLIGRGLKFEIWNPARLEAAQAREDSKRISQILNQIRI